MSGYDRGASQCGRVSAHRKLRARGFWLTEHDVFYPEDSAAWDKILTD